MGRTTSEGGRVVPIKVGSKIKSALPANEREGLEDFLLAKSGGRCHLCETEFNVVADSIEADHDVPEAGGGPTTRENLWLAHAACNRAKRDNPSVAIRPYLKLKAFLAANHHIVRYDGVIPHFGIQLEPTVVSELDGYVRFSFATGSVEVPVFTDATATGRVFRYCFVEAPREALFNDDQVQPRTLKVAQVWAIYGDLHANPLHEPPSCRLIPNPGSEGMVRLALFDGQHKTVAHWMEGNSSVCVKVYLDMTAEEANYLVNSIQAKIKKLPLSPFELSAKLSDEWMASLEEYRSEVPASDASEKGFIEWLDKADRTRARSAFEAALLRELVSNPDLRLAKYVHRAGQPKDEHSLMTETQFNNKILKRLLQIAPLEEKGTEAEEVRKREATNITWALNVLEEEFFQPEEGAQGLTDLQLERRRRFLYQGSMQYVADLVRRLYGHTLAVDSPREFLDKYPDDAQEAKIREGIRRIAKHPLWTAALDHGPRMKALNEALAKNQGVEKAFADLGLKTGYVVGADSLPNDWYS